MMPCLSASFLTYKLPLLPPPQCTRWLFIVLQPFDIIFQRENHSKEQGRKGEHVIFTVLLPLGMAPESLTLITSLSQRPSSRWQHGKTPAERERLLVSSCRIFHITHFSNPDCLRDSDKSGRRGRAPFIPLRLRVDHLICEVRCLRKTPQAVWEAV